MAALSPALSHGDPVFEDAERLEPGRTGLWCGRSDKFYDAARELAAAIPRGPAVAAWDLGAHTRDYWNRITPDAFRFIGQRLA